VGAVNGYATPAGPLRAMAEELVRAGVRDVVICPGCRSTPMALALRATPGLRCWVHLDERAGAFFALGAAKGARRPAAILATSGTAVVNFAPAVTEARYGRVPLILLTADRPPELHGRGAPQTIDQSGLFGRHAKWSVDLPVPEATEASAAHAREMVTQGVAIALAAPAGPVQLNLAFREPLLPEGVLAGPTVEIMPARRDAGPVDEAPLDAVPLDATDVDATAAAIAGARRGLIVCGPLDVPGFAAAVTRLAVMCGYPVLADGLSNVRCGQHDRSHVIAHHDALLRSDAVHRWPSPEVVLRFGAAPVSKALASFLASVDAPQLLIDDGAGWERPPEPRLVTAEPMRFVERVAAALSPVPAVSDWLARWQTADAAAAAALGAWRASRRGPFEGAIFESMSVAVPEGAVVLAGNSMPVRDLDAFLPTSQRQIRCLGNRGANGIDGLLSTALGVAAAQEQPVLAVVGDLSFLHDLTALVAARRLGLAATILLVNNDGGGIFSFLPQASAVLPSAGLPAHYEELFGTPHGTDFGPLVLALGAEHRLAEDDDSLLAAVRSSVGRPGVQVVEVRTERVRNVESHVEALATVARAVEAIA
jgi:2-succinyl-5-enolpyruvyl-6-hydroxy-3-cyclohexene-1-carboxylate synthase